MSLPAQSIPAPRERVASLTAVLAVVAAVPASVLAVPDATADVVPDAAAALGLADAQVAELLRATGLALPALVLAVAVRGARRPPVPGVGGARGGP
ncbi:hypothetical protein, partial [Actinomadura sp. CNU-125]|uniref:hypothetical protein n=1 Tax=Actinomadura sp. CNU-125 TaxID=1904961 RepID=UPI0021CD0ED8